ncbi:MAG: hypothetical protein ACE5EX_08480 [Phycisphaerae bacterium]
MYEQNREAAAPEGRGFLRPVADPARPDTPRRWLGRYLSPALLIVLVLAVFVPALDAGLVGWDDEDLVRAAMSHRSLTGDNLWWMFTTSYSGHFQPLTWLTYALDRAVWQRETFGYHLTNVCLHIATVLAFYYIARRLLSGNENRPEARYDTPVLAAAALAAALFAVHPLRSESVAWIAERRDVLSGCLYLASVLFYLRYVAARRADGEAAAGKRAYPYVTSVALCGLSLLAKASAVTLPVVLCILDRYPLRRFPRRPLQAHRPEIGMEVGPGGRSIRFPTCYWPSPRPRPP